MKAENAGKYLVYSCMLCPSKVIRILEERKELRYKVSLLNHSVYNRHQTISALNIVIRQPNPKGIQTQNISNKTIVHRFGESSQ